MLLKGLKAIGEYMGVHPTTILRWHRMYNISGLDFPLMPEFTGIGQGITYITHTSLIAKWIQQHSDRDVHFKKAGLKWPKQHKRITMGTLRRKAILRKIVEDIE